MSTTKPKIKLTDIVFSKKTFLITAVIGGATLYFFGYRPVKEQRRRAELETLAQEYWTKEINRKELEEARAQLQK